MAKTRLRAPHVLARSPTPPVGPASLIAPSPPVATVSAPSAGRRLWLSVAGCGAISSLGLLAGCGFALRRPADLGYRRIALTGFARHSELVDALRRALPPSSLIVDAPAEAEVVIAASEDQLRTSVAASTSAGQVREFRLRVSLRFRLLGEGGRELLGETEIEQQRDMSYTETAALAKETEQAALLREMRGDLVQQLLRMVAASTRASRAVAAAAPASGPASEAGR